ncbi:hypothetical protein HanRHA438_Chr05g0223521 [Helianthus annuus]|nr:hypothetical protein HanRHA438_Chr05g0223521 [Helianthus annuus]
MRESHGLETDLNRRMDFTGSLERISSMSSSGNEFLAFCADRSSGCSSSRVSIFSFFFFFLGIASVYREEKLLSKVKPTTIHSITLNI